MNSTEQAYKDKMQARLDEFGAEIDKLKAKSERAGADAKIAYQEQIVQLRAQKDAAAKKLSELDDAADDAGEDLKSGIEDAWHSLGEAIKTAKSRFSSDRQ